MNYSQSLPNNNQYNQQMNPMPGMPQMNPMPGMPQMNNQYGLQGTGTMGNPYQNQRFMGSQMPQYGYNQSISRNELPNINFSVPHQQNPNMNYSMNMGIGPYSTNSSYDFNPYDPNVNYMTQRSPSMMNMMGQTMFNMANHINVIQPDLERSQFLINRKKEKELMQEQTDIIKKNIQNDEETQETREERQKKMMLRYRGHLNKPPIEVYIPKSQYFNDRDRYFLEQLIMQPLKTNGIFGTQLVTDFDKSVLFEDKSELRKDIKRDDEDEYFENSMKDGIYLDYIKQIIYSYNIQKMEQRAAREGKKEWFRPNGDLRMDHDIFSDVITKPIDITLSPNESFSTFYTNNSLSGRESNRSTKVYKLRILISKLVLTYHPLFQQEDILANEVKALHKEYYSHMNQLNIPYLKNKIMTISQRMDEYSQIKEHSPSIEIEKKNMSIFLNETANFLEEEKKILNLKANQLYSKWLELKKLRETQKFQSTKLKLNVIRFRCNQDNPNLYDYAFVLSNTNVTEDLTSLQKAENTRRIFAKNLKCQIKIYINGIEASFSKPVVMQWPSFEADFNLQYIFKMLTRPAKMEFELFINEKSVQRFEAEPPGIFSKTVTSSSALFEEVPFGNIKEEVKKGTKEHSDNNTFNDLNNNKGDENEQLLQDKSLNKNQNTEANMPQQKEIEGIVLIKTEWEGRAPDLPPTKIEDKLELVNKQQDFQNLIKKYNEEDYPFDVNDPRNVAFVETMKKGRLELILKFLYKEYLLQYNDVKSLRQYLLLKRLEKESLRNFSFPILESEIEKNPEAKAKIEALMKDDEKLKIIDTQLEQEKKIKDIDNEYDNLVRNEENFQKMLTAKIRLMKTDEQHQINYSYFQVLSEAELYTNPSLLIKEFCTRVFSRSRKLAPVRIKPPPAKVEKTESIKINIHVIKAYNVPIRNEAPPTKIIDYKKLESVNLKTTRNVLLRNQMFDQMNAMKMQNNPMNYYGSMNNSGGFNHSNTNNNSFHVGGMIEPNNFPNPNYPTGSMGSNPNINNAMFNPRNPGALQMYNPNLFGNNAVDSLTKIQFLSAFERRVNSFIQVKIKYYDQEKVMRTDSVDSIHPDYNHQFEFTIKPKDFNSNPDKDKKVYFSREELSKCPGEFFFSLYDEVRIEKIEKEKDANTYIQRFEKKYLGSFSIPFATVFQNASILDTICKVDIPKTVFGYYSDSSSVFDITNSDKVKQDNELKQEVQQGIDRIVPQTDYGDSPPEDDIPKTVDPFRNTYVSLYITLDPVPNFTKVDDLDYVVGYEDSVFLINATKWLKKIKQSELLKNRHIKLFAENFNGRSTFIPKYIKPGGQKPPPMIYNQNDENSIEKAARFVSLIPFVEDNQSWDSQVEMPDCWCTDSQFLTLGFGDYEEHAILLLNYFNYIDTSFGTGCESFLVLGDAHPEGMTTYVMRILKRVDNNNNINNKTEVEFWNAKTGDCFHFDKTVEKNQFLCLTVNKNYKFTKSNSETICQLKSIGAIVTIDNIYVNIQKESDPALIDFDLENKSNWLPFLTPESRKKYFMKGIETVQQELDYSLPNDMKANKIKKEIEEYLENEIKKERAEYNNNQRPIMTNFNRTGNKQIEEILQQYENFCLETIKSGIKVNNNPDQNPNQMKAQYKEYQSNKLRELIGYQNRIKEHFNGQDIYGFPVNLSYTTNERIWEQVKLTDVHLVANENCELSLSVHVEAYPSEVYSIWIFFAIINKSYYG